MALRIGGDAVGGASGGLGALAVNGASSGSNANVGAAMCYIKTKTISATPIIRWNI